MDLNKLRKTSTSPAFLIALAIVISLTAVGSIFASSLVPTSPQSYEVCVDHSGKMRLLDDTLIGQPNDDDDDDDDNDNRNNRDKKNECKPKEFLIEVASAGQFEDLQAAIEILNSDHADMLGLLAALSTRVDVNEANVESNQSAISELEGRISALENLMTPTVVPTPTPTPTVVLFADYQAVLDIIGPNTVILPLVADIETNSFGSSFATFGDQALVFTWSEQASAFDTPPGLEGSLPVVTFNGTDEEADAPDAAFWSRGNGTSDEPFSVGGWFYLTNTTTNSFPFNKRAGANEWHLRISNDQVVFTVYDGSTGAEQGRATAPAVLSAEMWYFIVATYNGDETDADAGINIYIDGVDSDTTNITGGAYTAIENSAAPVKLGGFGSSWFPGKMAGGPHGPFFTHEELLASEVTALYELGKDALGLP